MTKDGKDPKDITRADLAQKEMGDNSLQGDAQRNVNNERKEVPNVKIETEGVIESFEKLDKDVRAEEDLGKDSK